MRTVSHSTCKLLEPLERIQTWKMVRTIQQSNYNVSICSPAVWIDAKDVDQLMLATSSFQDQSPHYNLPRCPSSPSSKKRIKKDKECFSPKHVSENFYKSETRKDIGLVRRVSKRLSKLFDDVDDDGEDDDKSLVYSDDESSIEDEDLYDADSSSSGICQVAILERIRQFSQLLFPRRDMMEIGDYK